MKGRDLISIADLNIDEIWRILHLAKWLKSELSAGRRHSILAGKVVALLFEKPSLRTRMSFDVAAKHLGGHCVYLSPDEVGLGVRERVRDVARVIATHADVLVARTFSHETVRELAEYADCPVVNGLSDMCHPTQALADILTIWERKGRLEGVKVCYLGDGNNVANSLSIAGALTGLDLRIASPPGHECAADYRDFAERLAAKHGSNLQFMADPIAAASGADVVYTDIWVSMGQKPLDVDPFSVFGPYQLNEHILSVANPDCLVMHDLPAHVGEEISEAAFESENSVVFEQAENKLHAVKGLLALIAGDSLPESAPQE